MYDVIGDIHGEYDALVRLLGKLGYRQGTSGWSHSDRKIVFVGDFIDRGVAQKPVLDTVMQMVDQGNALAVMGNHEFNALGFHTPKPDQLDQWYRPRTNKNVKQHLAFLQAYLDKPNELRKVLEFFRTLPLWLDLGDLRVVHACWSQEVMSRLTAEHQASHLNNELLALACQKGTQEYKDLELLLKGKELPLNNASFRDKDGTERHEIRVRWWDVEATTYQQAYLGPESARTSIPDDDTNGAHVIEYSHTASPLFLGHYWMSGTPEVLAPNIACVDYSVAKPGGKLVAYRWQGEQRLRNEHFVWVHNES